ncbi:MAG: tRNA lysidine(34) synthetase TilS [Dehalococcoidia bacterium]
MNIALIEQRFIAYWRERALGFEDATLVVAISGGGDSCALLALVCETQIVPRDRVVAAYFDHRLRGEDASREERRAVEALCDRYGVRMETGAWLAPARSEAAAREARYAFLADVARRHGAEGVATGHTSDDQVETVLMHALRGAGLYGLAGMAASSLWPFAAQGGPRLVRPLLALTRGDTRAYCDARGFVYVDDASNADRAFLRNRVRNELLPAIDAVAPGGRHGILRWSDDARAGVEAIGSVVDALVMDDGEGCVQLSRAAMRAVPSGLAPHVYRRALVRLLGDARDFGRRHYGILARAHDASTGSVFELPRGVVATVDADIVVLSVGALKAACIDAGAEYALPFAGTVGGWRIDVTAADGEEALRLPAGAVVRGRRPGDRMQPRGMRGHKKLQDYYIDRKVPRRERDAAPVIAVGGDVLWTPFGGASACGEGLWYTVLGVRAD